MAGPGGQEVGRISIRVVPNTEHFRQELKAKLEAIEDGLKAEIDVEPDMDGFREKVRAATSNLPDAEVKVDVDRSALSRIRSSVGGLLDRIDTGGSGNSGRFLAPFIDNFVLVAAVAAVAAPAIALVSGALAALPAAVAGIAAPIAAIALGMDGIKKAAESLSEPLSGLKESLSGTFQNRLTPVFDKLATVIPKLAEPLKVVANGISDVAESVVNMIVDGPGLKLIQDTISHIGDAISQSAPGITKLTNGLLGLAEGVSRKFPAVADWINQVGDSFGAWVEKVTADGSLDRAMGNFGQTLKGVLDIVGDIAKQGFEWLQDPNFGKSMSDFVGNLKTLVSDVLPGLGGLFEQISSFLNGVVPVLDRIDKLKIPGLDPANAEQKGNKGFGAFPGMTPPEPGKDAASETANSFQATIAVIEGWFAQMFIRIRTQAMAAFVGLSTMIQASLATAFTNIQGVAAAAWNGVVSVAAGVVAQVVAQFAQIPGRLSGVFGQLAAAAAGGFAGIVGAAASAMGNVVSTVANAVGQVISTIASIPGKAAGALAGLAGIGRSAGAALVSGLVGGILGGIGQVVAAAAKLAAAVASHMPHSPAETGPLSGKGWVLYSGQAIGQGLADGMTSQIGTVTEAAKSLVGAIQEQIDSGATSLTPELQQQIKQTTSALDLRRKELQVQKDGIPKEDKEGRKGIQAQMDEISALKNKLGLQKDTLGYADKYSDSTDSVAQANNIITDQLAKMIDLGKGFFQATSGQMMTDLGMSGQGAVPTIANTMLDWGTSALSKGLSSAFTGGGTTINVNSVDDALAARQNIVNKDALRYKQR